MPSGRGSSGGSRGSHSGGGSSGGSHRSGGGSSSSSYRRVRYHGRTLYVGSTGAVYTGSQYRGLSACRIILMIMVIILFTAFPAFSSSIDYKKQIEYDYHRYQFMIERAEEKLEQGDDSYFVTGTMTGYDRNFDVNKYYILYQFKDCNDYIVSGYTYSIYTLEEIKEIFSSTDKSILLVVDEYPITQNTDSINYDYKDMPETKDAEYVKALKNVKIIKIVVIVASFILVTSIISLIVLIHIGKSKRNLKDKDPLNQYIESVKNSPEFQAGVKRNQEQQHKNAHDNCLDCDLNEKYDTNENQITNDMYTKKRYCKYCGFSTTETGSKCPNCNAKME